MAKHKNTHKSNNHHNNTHKKNVLPNTYIPVLTQSTLINILLRLPRKALIELCYVWPKMVNTQPPLGPRQKGLHQRQWNKMISHDASEYRSNGKVTKRRIIDKIIFDYWPKGLNLLQLSQIDCQMIVERPNSYSWIAATVKDSSKKEVPVLLEPQTFLDQLAKDLSNLFMNYIYVCRHPKFPLVIIRIQVFDLQPIGSVDAVSNRPHIASHKPYFFAIPMNSPYIIHSPGNDLVNDIVMQAVEQNLSVGTKTILNIEVPENQKPIKSLEAMHILYGSSRFGNSLGIWTPYADDSIDISPLGKPEDHQEAQLQEKESTMDQESIDQESTINDLKKIANLKFKGSVDGKVKSQELFDLAPNAEPIRKRRKKTLDIYNAILDEEEQEDQHHEVPNEFTSIAPVQIVEFELQEKMNLANDTNNEEDHYSSITMRLSGNDVFGGLHELSTSTSDKANQIIDPVKLPNWLTGEEGKTNGIIRNGRFLD